MSSRSIVSLRLAVSLVFAFLVSACSDDRTAILSEVDPIDIPVADPGSQANQNISNPTLFIPDTFQVADGDALTLVWSEEFDGPDIDPEVWFFESGDGSQYGFGQITGKAPGWGNNELQYYLPDNAMIVNGVLEITARREAVGDFDYTSARINTRDRFAFQYGRIEASIKLPSGQGLWPAFWMLSQDSDYLCDGEPCEWAATGEIDIVEAVNLDGTGGNEIFNAIHYGGEETKFQNTSSSSTYTPGVDVTEDFHTYALEWDEDELRWYFDGQLIASENFWFSLADNQPYPAPFNQNFHILLNLAVGGDFPGSPNGTMSFPATMQVDWVRIYSGEDPSGSAATEPSESAPTPTEDAAGVISLFSDAYDDIAGIDYNPNWGQATVVTIAQIAGNQMLKYAGLDYQGTDFAGNPQDVSGKEFLHLDFWTADSTALNVYLISPGPAESAYALPVTPNTWVSMDIPLTEFAGVDLTNLIQLKFDGNGTVFLDNLYFAGEAPITAPTEGVPTPPTQAEADVISLFSGAYTDEAVTWPTVWSDVGAVTDLTIDGSLVREHLGVNFVGVEFVLDASAMTHLHVDVWTPDADSLLIRLVDFLGDGFAGPNGDTQGEQTFDLSSTQGEWVSLDIPLADFQAAGLTSLTDLNQLIFDPTPDGTTLYIANVYFYNADGTAGGGELLTNGDMEAGQAPWIGQATVVDDGGNAVLQGVVTAPDPGQPFLVNASQVVALTQDETYTLTFRARATVARNMIAGIGLNVGPFTNVSEIVPLTTEWQAYTYTLTATGFGGADSRVLFDMNGEAGDVFIDDVSLTVGSLLTNGNMEAGQAPWIGQATVVDDGGNAVLQGVVTAPDPGQPFLVNASQVFDITQDETYVLTFKARATVARNMIAGLGLNVGPFTNVSEIVPLTTAWQTFTYTITATGFGGADSRVLFDMNGEAGDVFIDDVAVAVLGP